MNQGDKVYVRWYGKVLEGSVVNTDDLFGLTAVRIPIQGLHATALYHPSRVYTTVPADSPVVSPAASTRPSMPAPCAGSPSTATSPAPTPAASAPGLPCADFRRLQQFKRDHWDNDRNHLRIDALDDFYRLFRDYMAMRSGMMTATTQVTQMAIEAPATPDEAFRDGHRPSMPAPRAGHNAAPRPSMPASHAGSPITYHKPVKHQTTQLSLW